MWLTYTVRPAAAKRVLPNEKVVNVDQAAEIKIGFAADRVKIVANNPKIVDVHNPIAVDVSNDSVGIVRVLESACAIPIYRAAVRNVGERRGVANAIAGRPNKGEQTVTGMDRLLIRRGAVSVAIELCVSIAKASDRVGAGRQFQGIVEDFKAISTDCRPVHSGKNAREENLISGVVARIIRRPAIETTPKIYGDRQIEAVLSGVEGAQLRDENSLIDDKIQAELAAWKGHKVHVGTSFDFVQRG